jgi:hypothetical protein
MSQILRLCLRGLFALPVLGAYGMGLWIAVITAPYARQGDPVAVVTCAIFTTLLLFLTYSYFAMMGFCGDWWHYVTRTTIYRRQWEEYRAWINQDQHIWMVMGEVRKCITELWNERRDGVYIRPASDDPRTPRIKELEQLESRLVGRLHAARTRLCELQFKYGF